MTSRMVSWRDNDTESLVSIAPSNLSTLSVVSIDSILSDSHMITPEALGARPAEVGAKPKSSLGAAEPTRMADDSFPRHDTYYLKDGNVTFLVGDTLYCVHRYFFCRDSVYFSTKFAQLGIPDHEPLSTIISLDDVERSDFDALLSIMYPANFCHDNISYEQWRSVIHLSTRWGFASIRKLALESIKPPTSYDQLLLARAYDIDHWVLPALSDLCERKAPISLEEARQMRIEDVVLVATVREGICVRKPRVDTDDITRRIKDIQAGILTHETSDDDSGKCAENEAGKKEPPKGAATAKADSHDGTEGVAPAGHKAVDKHGNDEHLTGTATRSQEAKIDPRQEQQQTPKITLKDNANLSSVKLKKKKKPKESVKEPVECSEGCANYQKKKQKMEPSGSEGQDQKKSASTSSTVLQLRCSDDGPGSPAREPATPLL